MSYRRHALLVALLIALLIALGSTAVADEFLPFVTGRAAPPVTRYAVTIDDCFLLDSTSRIDATGATFVNSLCKNGRGQVVFRVDPTGTVEEVLTDIEGGRGSLDIRPDGSLWLTVATSDQTALVFYRVPRWIQARRDP